MAGSYKHCLRNGGFDFELIENMGDAHEACEDMFWMIQLLAALQSDPQAAIEEAERRYYAGCRGEEPPARCVDSRNSEPERQAALEARGWSGVSGGEDDGR